MKKSFAAIIVVGFAIFSSVTFAEEKRDINGFLNLKWRMTIGEVEKICAPRLMALEEKKKYSYGRINKFEGIAELPDKFPSARVKGYFIPPVSEVVVEFENYQLWRVLVAFDPKYYEDVKKIIEYEYLNPNFSSKLNKDATLQRGDQWRKEKGCIFLRQFKKGNEIVAEVDIRYFSRCGS